LRKSDGSGEGVGGEKNLGLGRVYGVGEFDKTEDLEKKGIGERKALAAERK